MTDGLRELLLLKKWLQVHVRKANTYSTYTDKEESHVRSRDITQRYILYRTVLVGVADTQRVTVSNVRSDKMGRRILLYVT